MYTCAIYNRNQFRPDLEGFLLQSVVLEWLAGVKQIPAFTQNIFGDYSVIIHEYLVLISFYRFFKSINPVILLPLKIVFDKNGEVSRFASPTKALLSSKDIFAHSIFSSLSATYTPPPSVTYTLILSLAIASYGVSKNQ